MAKTVTFVIANPAESDTFEKNFNAEWRIPAQIQIKDPRKGKSGRVYIRYIPYESDIFVDNQQVEFNLVKHRIGESVNIEKPSFVGGFIRVSEDDTMLLKYLRNHPYNVKNAQKNGWRGKKFFEVNKKEMAKESLENFKSEYSLMEAVFKMDLEDLKATCLLTGVISHKDMYDKTTEEMRHNLLVLAKRDPEAFYDALDDELSDYKRIIHDCISNNILMLDGKNMITLANGDRFASVSTGDDVIEAAAEKISDPANKDTLDMLKRRLRREKGEYVAPRNEEELEERTEEIKESKKRKQVGDAGREIDNMTVETLFLAAKAAGIIESKTPYHLFEGKKLLLDGSKNKWGDAAIELLESDEGEETLESLRTAYFIYKKNN